MQSSHSSGLETAAVVSFPVTKVASDFLVHNLLSLDGCLASGPLHFEPSPPHQVAPYLPAAPLPERPPPARELPSISQTPSLKRLRSSHVICTSQVAQPESPRKILPCTL